MVELLEGHERRWILERLEDNDIPFVVVGGVAVKFYCPQRERGDVDLFIGADPAQIERLIARVRGFEARAREKLLSPRIGHAEVVGDGIRVDLFSFAPGLDFNEALQTATPHEEQDLLFPILSRDLLLRHKEEVVRIGTDKPQDHTDIELLRGAILRDA